MWQCRGAETGGICSPSAPASHLAHFSNILYHFPDGSQPAVTHQSGFSYKDGNPSAPALNPIVFFLFFLPLPIPSTTLLAGNIPRTHNPCKLCCGGVGKGMPRGALVVQGSCWAHLHKRGVASALGGFQQIRKPCQWSKGEGEEPGRNAGLGTVPGAAGCPDATQLSSRT